MHFMCMLLTIIITCILVKLFPYEKFNAFQDEKIHAFQCLESKTVKNPFFSRQCTNPVIANIKQICLTPLLLLSHM